jgi:diguanylate cyclase
MLRPSIDSYRRLAEIFHDVLSEEAFDALLDRVADALADLLPYDTLTIYRADEANRLLVPVLSRDRWAQQVLSMTIPFGEGITGSAVDLREPLLVPQVQLDPRAIVIPGTPPEPEALISVPLVARGRVKGALNVYRLGDDAAFTEEELELATRFGDAVALALDNAEVRARLERQAQTDSLTGLYNYRYFHEHLRAELARALRSHQPVAVLIIDLDDFKRVNDVYGHAVGDQVLVRIAELLTGAVRASDLVCRLGGEEFGILLPNCDAVRARGFAERLVRLLAETQFDVVGRITASIGITHAPEHALNPRELAAYAESAMMTAKAAGKSRVIVFGEAEDCRPDRTSDEDRDRRSIAHLKMLQSLVGKLNRLNDVAVIGETIIQELRALVEYHSGRVYLLDGERLVPIALRGEPGVDEEVDPDLLACQVGEGITGHVAATGRSVLIANSLDCPFAVHIPGTPVIEESIVAVPLCFSGRVTGVLLISKLGVDQFDDADVRLLEVLAGHASVALENARLYEAERREAARARESAEVARSLLALSRELAEADGLCEVLRRVAGASVSILGCQGASVWIQRERGNALELGAEAGSLGLEGVGRPAPAVEERVAARLCEREEPVVLEAGELVAFAPLLAQRGARCAVAPLHLDSGRLGLLAASWTGPLGEEPSSRTLALLAGIADQARLAIGNADNYESLEQTFVSTVEALATALEANDEYTSSHARSLTDMALRLGEELGLSPSGLKRLELGALFHDIGKIGIPSELLAKPGPLTASERAEVELHATLGERILAPIERLGDLRPIVRHCHENWDGTGYPDGLTGEAIPIESRIIRVCDSFHAMTADRPYRARLPRAEALQRLRDGAGTQFDPQIVAALLRLLSEKQALRAAS